MTKTELTELRERLAANDPSIYYSRDTVLGLLDHIDKVDMVASAASTFLINHVEWSGTCGLCVSEEYTCGQTLDALLAVWRDELHEE